MLGISWVQGDTEPLTLTITDRTGAALDISAATGVISVWSGSATLVNDAAVTVTDGANGLCEYRWVAGDVATAGTYEGRITFTRGGKTISTTKFALAIEARRG